MKDQNAIHNRVATEVVQKIVRAPLDAGGSILDVMVILESVIVGVCLVAIRAGGDETVFGILMDGAKKRIDTERFKAMPVASTDAPPKRAPHFSGEACTHCGNFSLVRSGTCMTCQICGETSGCS